MTLRVTYKLDKMLATAGLQISHPIASLTTPAALITSVKVRNFLTFMILNRSARGIEKCGQRLLFTSYPAFFNSVLKMFVTCDDKSNYMSSRLVYYDSDKPAVYTRHTRYQL